MIQAWRSVREHVAGSRSALMVKLERARAEQEALLLRILRANVDCSYGRALGFASIDNLRTFQSHAPVMDYGELERMRAASDEPGAGMLPQGRVVAFEETSGSSGGAKLIPYTHASLESFRLALSAWMDDLIESAPAIADGAAYWAISPALRPKRTTPSGIPIGLASDAMYFGAQLAQAIAGTLLPPAPLQRVHDVESWRRITLAFLLHARDLALISVWSPSFLRQLLQPLHDAQQREALLGAMATGDYAQLVETAEAVGLQLPPADPTRAAELSATFARGPLRLTDVWPQLALLSCWTHGSSTLFTRDLAHLAGDVAIQGKGLIATEGIVSIPLHAYAYPVLAIESGVYEFVDDSGAPRLCDELSVGQTYQVLMTNWSGLYRYALGDRVRVRGYAGQAPLLEFVARAGRVVDLVGEKLSEEFVLQTLAPCLSGYWLLRPVLQPQPHYELLSEAPSAVPTPAELEHRLCANPQYAYARRLGQLAPLQARQVANLAQRVLAHANAGGRKLGDVKPPVLWTLGEMALSLDD